MIHTIIEVAASVGGIFAVFGIVAAGVVAIVARRAD